MADENVFRPQRKPAVEEQAASESETTPQGEPGFQMTGSMPPELAAKFKKTGTNTMSMKQKPVLNPKFRSGGSSKLSDLLQKIGTVYEKIELPSKGKFYNGEDGPADGILHIRPMTGEEEEILATQRIVRKGDAIDMIFSSCISEQYNPDNFLVVDRTYLLIYLRGISYTPRYEVEIKCTECTTKFNTVIDLNDLSIEPCDEEFNEESLKGVLPVTGYSFSYHLARGTDEKRIQDYRQRKIKHFETSGNTDDTLLYKTAVLLNEVEGLSDKMELQVLLKKLPIQDVAHLRNIVSDEPFGVDTNVGIICPACSCEMEMELPLEANFFFPRTKKKA